MVHERSAKRRKIQENAHGEDVNGVESFQNQTKRDIRVWLEEPGASVFTRRTSRRQVAWAALWTEGAGLAGEEWTFWNVVAKFGKRSFEFVFCGRRPLFPLSHRSLCWQLVAVNANNESASTTTEMRAELFDTRHTQSVSSCVSSARNHIIDAV